jgi:hypothetical protein
MPIDNGRSVGCAEPFLPQRRRAFLGAAASGDLPRGMPRSYFSAIILVETELRAGHSERAMAALNDATAISDELGETFSRTGLLCSSLAQARCLAGSGPLAQARLNARADLDRTPTEARHAFGVEEA